VKWVSAVVRSVTSSIVFESVSFGIDIEAGARSTTSVADSR
jgi:hypothetical protein